MNSVEISALGQLKPTAALDFSKYPAPKAKSDKPRFVLSPAAEYDLRIVTPVTTETLSVSKTGNLNFKFDAVIVGGPEDGKQVRYQNASAAIYTQDGIEQSRLGNLVRALGGTEFPGVGEDGDATPQVTALQSVIGNTFRAYVTWKAEDRKFGTGTKVTGMKNFPLAEGGGHLSYIDIPGQVDDQGRTARVWANLEISNYIPVVR